MSEELRARLFTFNMTNAFVLPRSLEGRKFAMIRSCRTRTRSGDDPGMVLENEPNKRLTDDQADVKRHAGQDITAM